MQSERKWRKRKQKRHSKMNWHDIAFVAFEWRVPSVCLLHERRLRLGSRFECVCFVNIERSVWKTNKLSTPCGSLERHTTFGCSILFRCFGYTPILFPFHYLIFVFFSFHFQLKLFGENFIFNQSTHLHRSVPKTLWQLLMNSYR